MKTNKITEVSKKYSKDKLVINSITDLLKLPINKINNSKIENFSGIYFDKIYEEAIKTEYPYEGNKSSKSSQTQTLNKNLKQKEKLVITPKLRPQNKNTLINRETNNKILNIKHYYDDDTEIPPNKNRIEYKSVQKKNQKEVFPKDDDTQDNDLDTERNELYLKPSKNNKENIKKRKSSEIPINKIIFSINYNSSYGEEVAVLGSLSKLGLWQLNGALPLSWNEGNVWTGEINIEDDDWQNFEFKFIVVEKGIIKRWEDGENNLMNFDEVIKNIISNKVGRYNKYKYEYNKNEETLSIKCHWH